MKRVKRSAKLEQYVVPIPADRAVEIRFEFDADWDGKLQIPDVAGARVKPVLLVAEEVSGYVDREAIRRSFLEAGAVYCRAPLVHVARKVVHRDERHGHEATLEESVRIFAEETRPRDLEGKVRFALALAREADGEEGGR